MQVLDIAGASTANCARLEVYESHMADNQIFRFERDDDTGFYKVTCVGSGKVLDKRQPQRIQRSGGPPVRLDRGAQPEVDRAA